MTALLAALLASQAPAAVPFDLNHLPDRAEALAGRWVEFDAYVYLMGYRQGHALLAALTSEPQNPGDGRAVQCADNPETSAAVVVRGTSLGPLRRAAARPPGAYAGVRIRAVLRNLAFIHRADGYERQWPAYFAQARIVRVTGGRCVFRPALPS